MVDGPPKAGGDSTAGPRAADEQDYLLCIDGERSWRCELPRSGELVAGRSPEATLRLDDELVSRRHAQIMVVPDGLRILDLGSRHGTLVNGKRLSGPRLLASGDVITIGKTLLVVHRPSRMAGARALADAGALHARLEEEIERGLRYHRELGVCVLRASAAFDRARIGAALAGQLRLMDLAAMLSEHELAIIFPEITIDDLENVIQRLLIAFATVAPSVAAGIAMSPSDGIDADSLLSSARAAAESAAPFTIAHVRQSVRSLAVRGREIVFADPAMIQIYDLAKRLARSGFPILVRGETGVGKELAAAAVHQFSERSGPLVAINCAAIPESLAESELFGHEKGAFSGAATAKLGQLELANGGSVFLDEVGDLPLPVQAKLLRGLENQELTRVGDVRPRPIDVRVIAATNRDLDADIEAGKFRRDLYFRLAAGQLVLPPLRDRPRDLVLLAGRLLEDACRALERCALSLSVAATQALLLHRWPGNVRELKHAMSYAAATVPETGLEVDLWHLPASVTAVARAAAERAEPIASSAAMMQMPPAASASVAVRPDPARRFRPIADEVQELERQRIVEALRETNGVQNQAAALIEMPLRTFVTKLKRYRITAAEWTAARR